MNHDELVPARWTADDSMLLWQIDGKWGFDRIVLVELADGKIRQQTDLIAQLQKAILVRTREAAPQAYAAVRATRDHFGSWYRDGFAVDCVLDQKGPLSFPLVFRVYLTSNVKHLSDIRNVDSRMTASVARDGTVEVTEFHMGRNPEARGW